MHFSLAVKYICFVDIVDLGDYWVKFIIHRHELSFINHNSEPYKLKV